MTVMDKGRQENRPLVSVFMGNAVSTEATVRHEYGHCLHMYLIGLPNYTFRAAIPSIIDYWSGIKTDVYYSEPQEYIADMLGKANRMGEDGLPYQYSITYKEGILYFISTLIG